MSKIIFQVGNNPKNRAIKNLTKDTHLISGDYVEDSAYKQFACVTYDTLYDYIFKKNKGESYLYENWEKKDKVKLVMDLDISNPEVSKKDANKMMKDSINLVNKELKNYVTVQPEIIIQTAHRKGKFSFHIIYRNIYFDSIYHQKEFFSKIDEEKRNKAGIDMNIYKTGCFRMLGCRKMGKDNLLIFYKGINYNKKANKKIFMDSLVCNIPNNAKKIEIKISETTKNKIVRKKGVRKIKNGNCVFDDDIKPSFGQLEIFTELCEDLNSMCFTKYTLWRDVIFGARDWSNCKEVFDVVNKLSKEKTTENNYDKNAVIDVWNSQDSNREKRITIATIIHHHKATLKARYKDNKKKKILVDKQKEWNCKYAKLKVGCHIDQLEGVDKLEYKGKHINQLEDIEKIKGVKVVNFNKEFVTHKKTSKPKIFSSDVKKLKNKIIMIKSHTGSGKTVLLKYLSKQLDGHNIISLAARTILSKVHSDQLDTWYYKEKVNDKEINLKNKKYWFRNGYKKGMSVVLDSLVKAVFRRNEKYALFLDETSSLFKYLMNEKDNMKRIRKTILKMIIYLVLKAEYVFCVDADINTPTIQMLLDMANQYRYFNLDDKYFIDNIDVNKNKKIEEMDEAECFLEACKNNIKGLERSKEKFIKKELVLYKNTYVCKRKNVIEYSYINKFINQLLKDILKGKTVFVCSDHNKRFYNNVYKKIMIYLKTTIKKKKSKERSKLEKKILKQLKNGKFKYYSADKGDKTDFEDIKKIEGDNIFCSPAITTGIDLNYKATVYGFYYSNHLTADTIVQQLGRIRKPQKINLYFASNNKINVRYETIDEIKQDSEKIKKSLRKYIQIAKKDLSIEDIYDRFANSTTYLSERLRLVRYHTLDILKNKGHPIKYNSEFVAKSKLDKIKTEKEKTDVEKILEIRKEYMGNVNKGNNELFISIAQNNKKFGSFLSARRFIIYTYNDLIRYVNEFDELMYHQAQAREMKMLLLKKFMADVGIKSIKKVNYFKKYDKLSKSKKTFAVDKAIVNGFRLSKNKYKKNISILDARKLVLTMCNNLFPSYVVNKRGYVNDERVRYQELDYKTMNDHLDAFKYPKIDLSKNVFKNNEN